MSKGFKNSTSDTNKSKVELRNKKLGSERMISWSPWPPANFQNKYPAFPFVFTILLLFTVQIYFSLLK